MRNRPMRSRFLVSPSFLEESGSRLYNHTVRSLRHNEGIRNEHYRSIFKKTCSSSIAQRVFACRQKRASCCAKMGRNHSRQVFLAVLRSPVAHLCAKGADISCEHIKKEVHSASIFHLVAARSRLSGCYEANWAGQGAPKKKEPSSSQRY